MLMHWFTKARSRSGLPTRSFRPQLESLDGRLAPAVVAWDGGGGDHNWTTAANWVGDAAPSAGDELSFHHGTLGLDLTSLTNTNDFVVGTNFSSFHFFGAPPAGQRFVLGGNPVSLGAAGVISQVTGGTDQINLSLHLPATTNIRIDTVGGVGSTFAIEGAISGAGGFVKRGTSALTLRGGQANTYTGATTVEQGTMLLERTSVDGAIPAGSLTIGNGAGFTGSVVLSQSQQLGNGVALTIHTGSNFALGGSIFDVIGRVQGGGSLVVNSGVLNIGADSGTAIFTGTIHGTGILAKLGSGTQVFGGTAANPFTGALTVNQGRLVFGKPAGGDPFRGSHIQVGDGVGGTNADQLVLMNDNQIANTVNVAVVGSGVFDVNSRNDSISALSVDTGNVIDTGGAGSLNDRRDGTAVTSFLAGDDDSREQEPVVEWTRWCIRP